MSPQVSSLLKEEGIRLDSHSDCTCGFSSYLQEFQKETHPLGLIFDMDVLDANGIKFSRPTYRKCLLCDRQAQDCARSRRHSVSELQDKIGDLLMEFGYEL